MSKEALLCFTQEMPPARGSPPISCGQLPAPFFLFPARGWDAGSCPSLTIPDVVVGSPEMTAVRTLILHFDWRGHSRNGVGLSMEPEGASVDGLWEPQISALWPARARLLGFEHEPHIHLILRIGVIIVAASWVSGALFSRPNLRFPTILSGGCLLSPSYL